MKKQVEAAEPRPRLPLDAPWFDAALTRVAQARARAQLPQSLLIHAQPGAGGIELARCIAQLLLCEQIDAGAGEARACGQCRGCARVAAGTHPDYSEIEPLEDSRQIRIDQVREVLDELAMSSYEGRATVMVFAPAEAINHAAANALLKNLEEPRRDAYLILVASLPSTLPATIRSRCLRLALAAPAQEEALAWLQRHRPSEHWAGALEVLGRAPYEALLSDPAELVRLRDETLRTVEELRRGSLDVVRTAEQWAKGANFLHRLACLENYLTGLALRRAGRQGDSSEMRPVAHLSGPELDINIGTSLALLDQLAEIRQQASLPLNKGLALERFLWRFTRAAIRQPQRGV
jgi:DNA polymerase III subunit delta'